MENGEYLGLMTDGVNVPYYAASKPSRNFNVGKFKFCRDEACTAGAAAVDPGQGVRIRDLRGKANGGEGANQWLDAKANGGHIGKTPAYADAGVFTISKWTCGTYCLGGLDQGVGPTCPSMEPSLTFNSADPQSCMPLELVEVPCDLRDPANNCIWDSDVKSCE